MLEGKTKTSPIYDEIVKNYANEMPFLTAMGSWSGHFNVFVNLEG